MSGRRKCSPSATKESQQKRTGSNGPRPHTGTPIPSKWTKPPIGRTGESARDATYSGELNSEACAKLESTNTRTVMKQKCEVRPTTTIYPKQTKPPLTIPGDKMHNGSGNVKLMASTKSESPATLQQTELSDKYGRVPFTEQAAVIYPKPTKPPLSLPGDQTEGWANGIIYPKPMKPRLSLPGIGIQSKVSEVPTASNSYNPNTYSKSVSAAKKTIPVTGSTADVIYPKQTKPPLNLGAAPNRTVSSTTGSTASAGWANGIIHPKPMKPPLSLPGNGIQSKVPEVPTASNSYSPNSNSALVRSSEATTTTLHQRTAPANPPKPTHTSDVIYPKITEPPLSLTGLVGLSKSVCLTALGMKTIGESEGPTRGTTRGSVPKQTANYQTGQTSNIIYPKQTKPPLTVPGVGSLVRSAVAESANVPNIKTVQKPQGTKIAATTSSQVGSPTCPPVNSGTHHKQSSTNIYPKPTKPPLTLSGDKISNNHTVPKVSSSASMLQTSKRSQKAGDSSRTTPPRTIPNNHVKRSITNSVAASRQDESSEEDENIQQAAEPSLMSGNPDLTSNTGIDKKNMPRSQTITRSDPAVNDKQNQPHKAIAFVSPIMRSQLDRLLGTGTKSRSEELVASPCTLPSESSEDHRFPDIVPKNLPKIQSPVKLEETRQIDPDVEKLVEAVVNQRTTEVLKLLKKDVSPNKCDRLGRLPLSEACRKGFTCIAHELVRAGASLLLKDGEGLTPVMYAMKQKKLLENLLRSSIPREKRRDVIRGKDSEGRNILHHAVLHNNIPALHLLLEIEAVPNLFDTKYNTPLHTAISEKNVQAIHELIDFRADIHLKNVKGQSCIDLAKSLPGMEAPRRSILAALFKRPPTDDIMPEDAWFRHSAENGRDLIRLIIEGDLWPKEKGCTYFPMRTVSREDAARLRRHREGVYEMTSRQRGLTIIINNTTFRNHEKREGTDVDVKRLKLLFERLHFTVLEWCNLSAKDLASEIDKVKGKGAHLGIGGQPCTIIEKQCALIVVAMSHGKSGSIFAADGTEVDIEKNIITPFDGDHCPALNGKPKVFLIQACREKTDDPMKTMVVTDSHQGRYYSSPGESHAKADIAEIYSTYPGEKAARFVSPDGRLGAWFIDEFILTCELFAAEDDLNTLVTKANKMLGHRKRSNNMLQVARYESSLKKKLYFIPELTPNCI